MTKKEYNHLINRELSWLSFNSRVLDQSMDVNNPLLERVKFSAIFSNNLDEFFMVRVAGLKQQLEDKKLNSDKVTIAEEQIQNITNRTRALVKKQYNNFNNCLLEELKKHSIAIQKINDLGKAEKANLKTYFEKYIMPILTPIAFDPTHPFPVINNKSIEIAVKLKRKKKKDFTYGFVEIPSSISRFIPISDPEHTKAYVLLEELILANIETLFNGCEIISSFAFRITKDMDFNIEDTEDVDLMTYLERKLKNTKKRSTIRIELQHNADKDFAKWLQNRLNLREYFVYFINGPLNLASFFDFISLVSKSELVDKKILPVTVPILETSESFFDVISKHKTIPIFHPFESFDYVIKFLNEAVDDPNVLAIKQTLYRVSGNSPIVSALQRAAENGKQVTVILELRARFDEIRNISWAKRLEMSGAHVIYGVENLKVHCKALMIVRNENGFIKRYVHLATGNYNDSTAKVYTDIGVFMNDSDICSDIGALFNVMTGFSEPPHWGKISVAPFTLRQKFISLIDREIRNSTKQSPGHIIAKMNSLVDPEIIEHLYKAARTGVKIDLLIRGICCLKPEPGLSNLNIVSIVDRYLEHSRVFYFENNGKNEYYLSSADWMPRNLDKRIEILFPIEDKSTQKILMNILQAQLNDRYNGRRLSPAGVYYKNKEKIASTRSQLITYHLLKEHRSPVVQHPALFIEELS